MREQRAKLKLRGSDMFITQVRGESASRRPGLNDHKNNFLSPSDGSDGERDKGRGVSQFDRAAVMIVTFRMPKTNFSVERIAAGDGRLQIRTSGVRRHRSPAR